MVCLLLFRQNLNSRHFKWIFDPKMKMLSSFTPHVVPNLYDFSAKLKRRYFEELNWFGLDDNQILIVG